MRGIIYARLSRMHGKRTLLERQPLFQAICPNSTLEPGQMSHLISEEEPSASHMCARISSHTYDIRKWVKYHKQYSNVYQSLTTSYTHAGDSKVSNNGKR
jgi:hypothetical protein